MRSEQHESLVEFDRARLVRGAGYPCRAIGGVKHRRVPVECAAIARELVALIIEERHRLGLDHAGAGAHPRIDQAGDEGRAGHAFHRPIIAGSDDFRGCDSEGFAGRRNFLKDGAVVAGEFIKAGYRLLLDPVAVRQPKRLAVKREALFDAEFADQRLLVAHQLVMVAPARSLEIGGVRLGRQNPGQRLAARAGRHRQPGGSADLQIVK